jgi:hypothetical protein
MIIPSSYFLTKSGKQGQTGFDKYSSIKHIPIDENNALTLQKLCYVQNSESYISAIARETNVSSNPPFIHSIPDSSYVRLSYKQTNQRSAWPCHIDLSFLILGLYYMRLAFVKKICSLMVKFYRQMATQ